jgi:hypothetical protein
MEDINDARPSGCDQVIMLLELAVMVLAVGARLDRSGQHFRSTAHFVYSDKNGIMSDKMDSLPGQAPTSRGSHDTSH